MSLINKTFYLCSAEICLVVVVVPLLVHLLESWSPVHVDQGGVLLGGVEVGGEVQLGADGARRR